MSYADIGPFFPALFKFSKLAEKTRSIVRKIILFGMNGMRGFLPRVALDERQRPKGRGNKGTDGTKGPREQESEPPS